MSDFLLILYFLFRVCPLFLISCCSSLFSCWRFTSLAVYFFLPFGLSFSFSAVLNSLFPVDPLFLLSYWSFISPFLLAHSSLLRVPYFLLVLSCPFLIGIFFLFPTGHYLFISICHLLRNFVLSFTSYFSLVPDVNCF
jgi:hypothetical protein